MTTPRLLSPPLPLPILSPDHPLDSLKTKLEPLLNLSLCTAPHSDIAQLGLIGSLAIEYIVPLAISDILGADWTPTTILTVKTEILSTASIAKIVLDGDLLHGLLRSSPTDIPSSTLDMVFRILVGWIHRDSQLTLLQPWITSIFTPNIKEYIQNLPNSAPSTTENSPISPGFTITGASSTPTPSYTSPTTHLTNLTPPPNILMLMNEALIKYQLTDKVAFNESRAPDLKWKITYILRQDSGESLIIGTAADAKKKDAKSRAAQNALSILRKRGMII